MTKKDKQVLIDGLRKLAADVADLASMLEGSEGASQKQAAPVKEPAPTVTEEAPAKEPAPAVMEEAPAKAYTYEEVRAILAEKSRTGFRAEVKALLSAHGVKQLSDVKTPEEFAAIIAEAEVIGNG
jgi:hypothetical protein